MQDAGAAGSSLEPDRRAIKNLLKEITATGESADGVLTSVRALSGWICGGALARPLLPSEKFLTRPAAIFRHGAQRAHGRRRRRAPRAPRHDAAALRGHVVRAGDGGGAAADLADCRGRARARARQHSTGALDAHADAHALTLAHPRLLRRRRQPLRRRRVLEDRRPPRPLRRDLNVDVAPRQGHVDAPPSRASRRLSSACAAAPRRPTTGTTTRAATRRRRSPNC